MNLDKIPQDLYHGLREAFTLRPDTPTFVQPERQQLKEHLQKEEQFYSSSKARSSRVFAHCLNQVNDNLISHQHTGLPAQKTEGYKQLASEVYRGERSNTSAFMASAGQWLDAFNGASTQRDKVDCLIGLVANTAGGSMSGALDDNNYKTGKAFHPAKE
ncbi:hypothetical protein [Vibrio coralliilyticus]|uniref:Uncharacterized protein n=1 Tax=Vibrio coralliilyticus TaxID=190893 RepID=A0AAP6ZLP9_9VIBR|nr:hypothetical protein [Vibrio coralliilyticus]NOJ24245.1 hypothetical protein [Vibrio coralliilyticus]